MAGNAGLFGGLGPNAYVAQTYAPLRAQLTAEQNARLTAFQNLISDALARTSDAVQNGGAPYANAIQDTNNLARQSAAGLAAANPNDQTQAMLRAIGAPSSQQQAVGQQNNTVFNGGSSLLGYTGGVIPSTQFGQDAQARTAYLASLPGNVANIARLGVAGLANTAAKENTTLDQQQMSSLQQARSDLANYVQKNRDFRFKVGQANERISEFNAKQTLAAQRLNDENFWKGKNYNLQVTKADWQQSNADRNYGLRYSQFKLAEQKAARAAKTGGVSESTWRHAAVDVEQFYHGVAPQYRLDASGQRQLVPGTGPGSALTYQGAIKTLIRRYPGIGATGAIKLANSIYQPGEGGRPTPPISPNSPSFVGGVVRDFNQAAHNVRISAVQPMIVEAAQARGLDPRAVLAVASQEGAGGGVGDNGTSFGPFQLHIGGAFPSGLVKPGQEQAWAWSPAGINYALDRMASVARGLTGEAAVNAIVRRFERPANPDAEVAGAVRNY